MEMSWPGSSDGLMLVEGTGRDLLTQIEGRDGKTVRHDRISVRLRSDRTVESCTFEPPQPALGPLVGQTVLKGWRRALEPLVGQGDLRGRPLVVLLDDLVGCCIIETWIKANWDAGPSEIFDRSDFENVCIGYATGSSGLSHPRDGNRPKYVPALERADDPIAFHPLAPDIDRTLRRVRRIDVWREEDSIHVDAMFQDSGVLPGTRRSALHEYRVFARLVRANGCLTIKGLEAFPGRLPYAECSGARYNIERLLDRPLSDLRATVHRDLNGASGCTHLNDAIRSLAEVEELEKLLP